MFTKKSLQEYQATFSSEKNAPRTVLVIAESEEAAALQFGEFAKHLNDAEGTGFVPGPVAKLENFHVTFTPAAWELLKS